MSVPTSLPDVGLNLDGLVMAFARELGRLSVKGWCMMLFIVVLAAFTRFIRGRAVDPIAERKLQRQLKRNARTYAKQWNRKYGPSKGRSVYEVDPKDFC